MGAEGNEATRALLDGYARASRDRLAGLGYLYATETADLVMVSGVGNAVRRATGVSELPWVDIHVQQEPGHVEQASQALEPEFDEDEESKILRSAEEMWSLWIDFFEALFPAGGESAERAAEARVARA